MEYLNRAYDHSMKDDRKAFVDEMTVWLRDLTSCVKGDTWETEILQQALRLTVDKISALRDSFIKQT
jgi:hypothetical protein